MTVVVFAPHEDDETLGCGGTIAKKINAGEDVHIVFMTDGRNSHKIHLKIYEDPTPEELKEIRKKESKEATKILGVKEKNLIFLDFEDGNLKNSILEAEKSVKKLLTELKPTEIYIPTKNDSHPDHRSTNLIVLSAVKKLSLNLNVYESIIWPGPDTTSPRFFIDISDVLDKKNKAISVYKSQISEYFPSQVGKGPILNDRLLLRFKEAKEHFVTYTIKNGQRVINNLIT